ncbi:MAG: ROK family protein [Acidimicrobiia bacterium]|nr:ROK family protein [Acidimicrobiia bacterium]MYG92598.1 ROK family protein [Acidimicrobiia bacterium]MYH06564.1 ROK family protein [Acidimicrobiia bacterium]MYK57041.1 ROK family protein [Acidimicrobiia bacterium]
MAGRKVALAVDVGGTKIAAALVDRRGRVRSLRTVPTGAPGAESLRRGAEVAGSVAAVAEQEGLKILGTGIGMPELVEDGGITSDSVVAWTDAGVAEAFSAYGPIRVEADIRAAALAEARLGGAADEPVVVYVNLGTGISHCLLIEGRPFEGRHGRALMSGSTLMKVLDVERNVLVGGCVEDVASGRGISERYERFSGQVVSAEQVFERAAERGGAARLVVDQSIELWGHMVANLVDILDPGLVIVGGGLAGVTGLIERIGDVARRSVWSDRARETPVTAGVCGPLAGVIGAGLILFDSLP